MIFYRYIVTTRHVTKACGCTVIVFASGSPRCWRICGQVAALGAGVRNSGSRIYGLRRDMIWRLKLVTASVEEDILGRLV